MSWKDWRPVIPKRPWFRIWVGIGKRAWGFSIPPRSWRMARARQAQESETR